MKRVAPPVTDLKCSSPGEEKSPAEPQKEQVPQASRDSVFC